MANGGDFLGGNEMSFANIGVFVVLDQLSKRARSLYCHLSALHDLMKSHGNGAFFAKSDGNHRVVQPVNTQDPVIITNDKAGVGKDSYQALFITFLALFILSLVACIIACVLYVRAQSGVLKPRALPE